MDHDQERLFGELEALDLGGATIIEMRGGDEPENIVGVIEYSGRGGYATLGVGWRHNGMNRTTQFSARQWRARKMTNVIELTRTAPNKDGFDQPWDTANTYFIVRKR